MLEFCHTDKISDLAGYEEAVIEIAFHFGCEDLWLYCEEELIRFISLETSCSLLVLAHRFNLIALKENCLNFIALNSIQIRSNDMFGFQHLSSELTQEVIRRSLASKSSLTVNTGYNGVCG
uniref:Uncharacterized protein n=1 Tax=Panagrolaimus sp. JU765 TaxID=591449 RepID=A0AC34R592_9BILA